MNFFNALRYINIRTSFIRVFIVSILTFIPGINFIGIPIVLGSLLRAIPEINRGTQKLPSFTVVDIRDDFFRGLIVGIAGLLFFSPSLLLIHQTGLNLHFLLESIGLSDPALSSVESLIFNTVLISGLTISSLLFTVGTVRYAYTDQPGMYMRLRSTIDMILTHPFASLSFLINVCVSFVLIPFALVGILTFVGFFLVYTIWMFALSYLMACYASELDLSLTNIKRKNDQIALYEAPKKQTSG